MENTAYKNRKNELNELINFILNGSSQIFLYHSHAGYGNTAFISRVKYLICQTPSLQIFHAELTRNEMNPLHAITKSIAVTGGKLYQRMQLFSDNEYGVRDMPILSSIIKDLTQSETLSTLLSDKTAIPVYAGFYQDRLKEVFFHMLESIIENQKVIIFIDNIQYMDEESIFELQAVLNNPKIKLVCFKTGDGNNFEKFYYETKFKYAYMETDFPEPDGLYVKKLGEIYRKQISEHDADIILYKSKKDIRKILYYLRMPSMDNHIDTYEQQILNMVYFYDDYIDIDSLHCMIGYTPYCNIFTASMIDDFVKKLEVNGFIQHITHIDDKKNYYKVCPRYSPSINIADKLILTRALLVFYKNQETLEHSHLIRAWKCAHGLCDERSEQRFSLALLKESLLMGYPLDGEILNSIHKINTSKSQILLATFLFCNAQYGKARSILEKYMSGNPLNRAQRMMYAIILNRCREHSISQIKLSGLIKTSKNQDETAILAAFLISNHIHNNKRSKAVEVYEYYNIYLMGSIKYPYFLRNAATIFRADKAYELRNTAKILFKENNDYFGYYGTIVNMTSYYLKKYPVSYAINQIQLAFEGLQQFNANQIHLAANNLGVCYLMDNNYLEALKYFDLSRTAAKSIMPITYASINLSALHIKCGNYQLAQECLIPLHAKVFASNLPRLKIRYFLQKAFVEFVIGDFKQAQNDCDLVSKYLNNLANNQCEQAMNQLLNYIKHQDEYVPAMWSELYLPCYLEYWTINSIDILSNQILSC